MSVKPAVPAPAATLVLLRDRPGGGVETLLIQRHHGSRFAPGDYVFPGGRVEPADAGPAVLARCAGPHPGAAARRLGLAGGTEALGYWVAAVREAFEEVAVLLAYRPDGGPLGAHPGLAEHRRRCRRDDGAFRAMLEAEDLRLATDRLVYFAHWITPEERPLRFDTRFFAAPMPPGQEAVADGEEIVDVRWLSPAEALAARAAGALPLRLPTARNLALLEDAATVAGALERLDRLEVAAIRPVAGRAAPGS